MLTHRELKAMPEMERLIQAVGELFVEHSNKAIAEEHDIGTVRYHKGWLDAINQFIDLFEELFPDPDEDKRDELEVTPGESIVARRSDGSVY